MTEGNAGVIERRIFRHFASYDASRHRVAMLAIKADVRETVILVARALDALSDRGRDGAAGKY